MTVDEATQLRFIQCDRAMATASAYIRLCLGVVPPCWWAKTYADRVACCPLVNHDEYADGTDRQTDGRQTVALRFPLDAASVT